MKTRCILSLLILVAISMAAHSSAGIVFRHWDESIGLPSDQIRSFSTLDDGRIAMRIPNGTVIFDGSHFKLQSIDRERQYTLRHSQKNVYTNYKDSHGNLWLKSPGYLTVYDPAAARYIYDIDSILTSRYGLQQKIRDMYIDGQGDMWFITADDRLVMHDSGSHDNITVVRLDGEWRHTLGYIVEIASHNHITTICTSSGILKSWDKTQRRFIECDEFFKGLITDPDKKFRLAFDSTGRTWAMYDSHIWIKSMPDGHWREILSTSGGSNFFTSIAVDHRDNVWIGSSWSGLRVIDGNTLGIDEYPRLQLESGDELSNDIQEIHVDHKGGIWIGTLWQGVAYYHDMMNPFTSFHTADTGGARRSNESVRSFIEEPDGDILIATSFNGIIRYNPTTGITRRERPDIFPADDVYMCLYRDSHGALWTGSYNNGFIRLMPDGSIQRYNRTSASETNISRAVHEAPDGRFWVSVNDMGSGILDTATGHITMLNETAPRMSAHRRDYGFIRINDTATGIFGENGLHVIDNQTIDTLDRKTAHDIQCFADCNSALVDSRGFIWCATDNGLIISSPDKNAPNGYTTTRLLTVNSPLPGNYISTVIEDKYGQIWITTTNSLVRIIIRPDNDDRWQYDMTTYMYGGCLNAGRITENATFMSSTGDIYIGGYNGVIRFNPRDLATPHPNDSTGPLITGISLFGKDLQPGDTTAGRIIVDTSLLNGRNISLDHDENFITIHFSSLDFISGAHKHYRYRLKGYDPDWVRLDAASEPQAIYTGIPPGTYRFEVMASGIDGSWDTIPAFMTITVTPPAWHTWWAFLIYALVIASVAMTAIIRYRHRRQRQHREEAERREFMQREQLNQMKFQFFTNISHEFRTPLALIMTPLSHLLSNEPLTPRLRKKLSAIYSNAENLLEQVNRLLDFRKLEMGGEKINISRCRIVQFVSCLISSFDNICADKKITLTLESDIPEYTDVYLDTHKLRHILTNLYSNAIKFTPDNGTVTTTLATTDGADGRRFLQVTVSDSGIGIDGNDLPHIFDRFYQAGNPAENPSGSGIGLHLVREYIRLHGGSITAASAPGEGTTFSFTIPMDMSPAQIPETGMRSAQAPADNNSDTTGATARRPFKVLIAEDNNEFRDFLSDYLSAEYSVETACDGAEALEMAGKSHPDIIVSDLMMPRMTGLELISRLKNDISTSHIPVILLTAKASDESRIESYKAGADSYISKPFNYDVLQARLRMLLTQARNRHTRFRQDAEIEPSAVTITSLDEKMVKKALETVEANMDNSSFSTAQLGEALGLSRSQLYRKFESVTGMSPADFILRMRLKRAAQLLRDSTLNVSEIADMTGFNSIKYFNKHFKEEYNLTPTGYRSSQS